MQWRQEHSHRVDNRATSRELDLQKVAQAQGLLQKRFSQDLDRSTPLLTGHQKPLHVVEFWLYKKLKGLTRFVRVHGRRAWLAATNGTEGLRYCPRLISSVTALPPPLARSCSELRGDWGRLASPTSSPLPLTAGVRRPNSASPAPLPATALAPEWPLWPAAPQWSQMSALSSVSPRVYVSHGLAPRG